MPISGNVAFLTLIREPKPLIYSVLSGNIEFVDINRYLAAIMYMTVALTPARPYYVYYDYAFKSVMSAALIALQTNYTITISKCYKIKVTSYVYTYTRCKRLF